MNGVKSWFMSTGIWGGVIGFVGVIAPLFGYHFGLDDQTLVGQQVDTIVAAVGVLLGVWGRVRATKQLGL